MLQLSVSLSLRYNKNMLYLITNEQRKKIIDEYQSKIWVVSCIGLVLLAIIFFVLSIPTILSIRAEANILAEKARPLEVEESLLNAESSNADSVMITKNIAILQLPIQKNIRDVYKDVVEVFESVSGVVVQTIDVDSVSKTVNVTSMVRDKEVAKKLVEQIQKTKYAGANLPYTVLSQKASFVFNQKLTYKE